MKKGHYKFKRSSLDYFLLHEAVRSRLSYYGMSVTDLDNRFDCYDDWMVAARIGLAIVDSIAKPSEAYYIQNVILPASIHRDFPHLRGRFKTDFLSLLNWLFSTCPNFYNDCISWPASIRY